MRVDIYVSVITKFSVNSREAKCVSLTNIGILLGQTPPPSSDSEAFIGTFLCGVA